MEAPDNIYLNAREIADPAERSVFLAKACGSDDTLRERVEAMLQDAEGAEQFFGRKATLVVRPDDVSLTEGPGTLIGRYKLLQQIGEGGMGVVYMAEQREPVIREVALKIIKPGMDTRQVVARFEAERQALAMMDDPHIAKVLDGGVTETGRPYFVMELVQGLPIIQFCDEARLPTRDRLDLFLQVCSAIQHAHQKGIIHRDIKPSNVLVTLHGDKPVPKVIDFGIAKATQGRLTDKTLFTQFQQFIGTPAYMSPEQASLSGLDIDTRSDIYALGVLLYELLTGKTPFDGKELVQAGLDEMRRVIREKEPPRPSTRLSTMQGEDLTAAAKHRQTEMPKLVHLVRGDLDWIVMKCLEKDRTRRYETANGLAMDLQRHLHNEPVVARPPSPIYRFQKTVRRNKLAFAAAGAVAIALIVGLSVATWSLFKEKQARQRAVVAEQAAETARANEARQRQQAQAGEQKARTESAKSRRVARFLKDMLNGVGPSVAAGRDTTLLREILDKTAERVRKDLTNQPEVEAELLETMGYGYMEIGPVDKAEAMQREALALRRDLFGNEHPDVARSLWAVACCLCLHNQQAEAEGLYHEALAMQRKLLGNDSPEVLPSLIQLGGLLSTGKPAEGETLEREALQLLRKLYGNEHPDTPRALNYLGRALDAQGKFDEAESVAREALALERKLFGNDHVYVADSLWFLGVTLRHARKAAEAETVLREAVAVYGKVSDRERSANLSWTLGELAAALGAQGKFAEEEASRREELAIQRKVLGDENLFTAATLEQISSMLRNHGKLAEAESLARQCLVIREKQLPGDWLTFSTRSLLGGILLRQKKYAEAGPLLLSGYEGMKQREDKIPAENKARLKESLQRLVQFHEATDQPDQAAEWKQKVAEYDKVEK